MPGILELPGELVDNIACRLGSDDKFSLRLTCRELEQKSRRAFGLHHFTKKCVHLTTDSLTVLLKISESEKLRDYVRDVTLITALFSAADTARVIVPCKCCSVRNPNSHEEGSYRFYIEDQLRLRKTRKDQTLLVEAFRLLTNLNTVALVDSEDRLQPGTDYQGGRKVLRKTGTKAITGSDLVGLPASQWRILSDELVDHFGHLWNITWRAIQHSRSIRAFKTDCASYSNFVTPDHFRFETGARKGLEAVFGNLTRIELNLTETVTTATGDLHGSESQPPDWNSYHVDLSSFASSLTSLESLRLCFDEACVSNDIICLGLLAQVDTAKLKHLQLIGLALDSSSLESILASLDQVADLRLEMIDIIEGTWPEVLRIISRYKQLRHLDLFHLRESGLPGLFFDLPGGENETTRHGRSSSLASRATSEEPNEDDREGTSSHSNEHARRSIASVDSRNERNEPVSSRLCASPKICLTGPRIHARLDVLWNSYSTVTRSPFSTDDSILLLDPTVATIGRGLQEFFAFSDMSIAGPGPTSANEIVMQSIEVA